MSFGLWRSRSSGSPNARAPHAACRSISSTSKRRNTRPSTSLMKSSSASQATSSPSRSSASPRRAAPRAPHAVEVDHQREHALARRWRTPRRAWRRARRGRRRRCGRRSRTAVAWSSRLSLLGLQYGSGDLRGVNDGKGSVGVGQPSRAYFVSRQSDSRSSMARSPSFRPRSRTSASSAVKRSPEATRRQPQRLLGVEVELARQAHQHPRARRPAPRAARSRVLRLAPAPPPPPPASSSTSSTRGHSKPVATARSCSDWL